MRFSSKFFSLSLLSLSLAGLATPSTAEDQLPQTKAALGELLVSAPDGIEADPERGSTLLSQSCAAGLGSACAVLAGSHEKAKRSQEAFEAWSRACDLEIGQGCRASAGYHKRGKSTPKDKELARQLLFRACSLGDEIACSKVD